MISCDGYFTFMGLLQRWDSGDIYDGEWKHGMMHGLGRFTFANGSMRPIQAPP